MLEQDVDRVLITEQQLKERIGEMGRQIAADYAGKPLTIVGILKGAAIFFADLARAIDLPLQMDFMSVSSYGNGTTSSGVVKIIKDLDADVTGRHILLVEDIIDTGITLAYLKDYLGNRGAESVKICALLDKPTMVWDFHSLLLAIKIMLSMMLTDEDHPLRLCRQCQKAFISRSPCQHFSLL